MSVRQYVISDTPTIKFIQSIKDTNGTPSVVWQQQMEQAYNKTYKIVHNDRPDRYNEMDYTLRETQLRPLQLIEDYNPHYFDTDPGKDPYWDDSLYDQMNLHFRRDDYPPTDDEDDPAIADNKLSRTVIEPWQPNPDQITLEETQGCQYEEEDQEGHSLFDEKAFLHVLVAKQGEPSFVSLSTNLGLKYQRQMFYFSMDFGEVTIDGPIDTGALTSAIPATECTKKLLLALLSIAKVGPAPTFQIIVANGQLEAPKSTVEIIFENGDIDVHEILIVMEKLTGPIIGRMFV